jgi:3-oxoacyl-[acyl-carrier-protein] synthase-3
LIQHALGASCGAIDLNAGCSGFVQAVIVAHGMFLQSGRPVLVVGADTYSRIMNWSDRNTALFFGDGAGALVIGKAGSSPCLLSWQSGSDGSGGSCITTVAGGSRRPMTADDLQTGAGRLSMKGRAVWEFAVGRVPGLVRDVVAQAGLSLADVDLIVPHQANQKMLKVIADELGVSEDVFFSNVAAHANTAAASVGIALDHAVASGRLRRGQVVVIVGFGAGLAWSAACLRF